MSKTTNRAHALDDLKFHQPSSVHPGTCPGCTLDETRWGSERPRAAGPARKTTVLPVLGPATALRKSSRLSAAALADKLGCSRANVFQTERRGGGISVATLWDWAESMGMELKIVAYPKRTEPSELAADRERVSAELAAAE